MSAATADKHDAVDMTRALLDADAELIQGSITYREYTERVFALHFDLARHILALLALAEARS